MHDVIIKTYYVINIQGNDVKEIETDLMAPKVSVFVYLMSNYSSQTEPGHPFIRLNDN